MELESYSSVQKKSLYVSCSKDFSTAFLYSNNEEFTNQLLLEAKENFIESGIPKRHTELAKTLKAQLKERTDAAQFLGEFKTVCAAPKNLQHNINDHTSSSVSGSQELDFKAITNLLVKAKTLLEASYNIKRQRATEAITFLLSDTDRMNAVHGVMAAYCLSGYSLSCNIMRKIINKIYLSCVSEGAKISCLSFDGQWHNIMARGMEDKPRTQYQLQLATWKEVYSMKKDQIIKKIALINANPCHEYRLVQVFGRRSVSSLFDHTIISFPKFIPPEPESAESTNKGNVSDVDISDDVSDLVSDVDAMCTGVNETVFELITEVLNTDDYDNDCNSNSKNSNCLASTIGEFLAEQVPSMSSDVTTTFSATLDDADGCFSSETDHSDQPSEPLHRLNENDLSELLNLVSKNMSTESISESDLKIMLSNANSLYRFKVLILKDIIRWLKQKHPAAKLRLSGNKTDLVNVISLYLCSSDKRELDPDIICRRTTKRPLSLQSTCLKVLQNPKKYSKLALMVSYSSFLFVDRLRDWKNEAPVSFDCTVGDIGPIDWFYVLDTHPDTGDLLVSTVDHHHLFIRVRMALVRGKLTGVSVSEFVTVAESGSTLLTRAIIVDGLEQQSEDFARITFSEEVEEQLRKNGALPEAEFCRLVRNWNRANDEPGISSTDRLKYRYEFRKWLLDGISFSDFPPKRSSIKGFPVITFEAVLAAIDGYTQLHALIPNNCYNVRSVNTNDNETYHSIVYSLSNRKYGIPDCHELEALQARIWNCHHMKMDPEMPFQIRTAKKPIYIDRKSLPHTLDNRGNNFSKVDYIETIQPEDHFFDTAERKRAKPRHKVKGISKWLEPAKGVRGVREYYKVDESQLSMLTRMGLSEAIEE